MPRVLNWERPESNNVQSIPILDEFYFTNSKGSIFQDNHDSAQQKLEYNRRVCRENPSHIIIDVKLSTSTSYKTDKKDNQSKEKNSWLCKMTQHPSEKKHYSKNNVVKSKRRLINTYKTNIHHTVDNSIDIMKIRDQYNTNMSTAFACTAMLEYVYIKALKDIASTCEVSKNNYLYDIRKYQLVLCREISGAYSEYIAISQIDGSYMTIILNNNLTKLTITHPLQEKIIEGLLGRAYDDSEYIVFQDLTNDNTLYFLTKTNYENDLTLDNSILNGVKRNSDIQLSPKFIRYNAGLSINDSLESMTKVHSGVCTEDAYPMDSDIAPDEMVYRSAMTYYIDEYYRIDPTIDSIRAFLIEGYCVIGGFDCTSDIDSKLCTDTGVIPTPVISNVAKKMIGGHCVLFVGFDDNKKLLKFKNSWGESWGDKGYGYLPYDYVLMGFAADFWVIFKSL